MADRRVGRLLLSMEVLHALLRLPAQSRIVRVNDVGVCELIIESEGEACDEAKQQGERMARESEYRMKLAEREEEARKHA